MKKVMNKFNFAIISMMATMSAFGADPAASKVSVPVSAEMCKLLVKMQGVFHILRAAAFIGAAFFIAGWAWTYISNAGDDKKGFTIEDAKKKGTGLLVGFTLLFIIGIVISFIMSSAGADATGCPELRENW